MNVSSDMAVRVSDGILFTSFESDRYVLLEIDQGNYFELEGSAGFLWAQWRQEGSVAQSIARVAERYHIDPAVAEADVLELIADLEEHQLITVTGRA